MKSSDVRTRLSPPVELQSFTALHLVLTVLCLGAEVLSGISKLGYPYDFPGIYFLRWPDLFCFHLRFAELHRIAFFSNDPALGLRFMYPAPVALLYRFFYAAWPHSLALFLCLTLGLIAILAAVVLSAAVRRGLPVMAGLVILGSAILLGYPFWFEYLLGNMEICIFLLIAFGVLALLRNRTYTAAALFGIAVSLKIFPFVYFGLLVSRRLYRQAAFGLVVLVLFTLGSLWVVYPSIGVAWHGINTNVSQFRELYMLRYLPVETGFDHSIFGLLKRLDFRHHTIVFPLAPLLNIYLPIAAASGLALYVAVIRKLPLLNQLLLLTIASILLPPTSHDYTLLHLYTPWAALVLYSLSSAQLGRRVRGLLPSFICFAILLAPQSEFIHDGRGFGGQIKCVVLIILFALALRFPFSDDTLDQNRSSVIRQPAST